MENTIEEHKVVIYIINYLWLTECCMENPLRLLLIRDPDDRVREDGEEFDDPDEYLRQIRPVIWYRTLKCLDARSQIPNEFIFDGLHNVDYCHKRARRDRFALSNFSIYHWSCAVCRCITWSPATMCLELIHRPEVWSLLKENTYLSNCMTSGKQKFYFYIDIHNQRSYVTKVGSVGFKPKFGSTRTQVLDVCLSRLFSFCPARDRMPTLQRLCETKIVLHCKTARNLSKLDLPERLHRELYALWQLIVRYTPLFVRFKHARTALPLLYADVKHRPPFHPASRYTSLRNPRTCDLMRDYNNPSVPRIRWHNERPLREEVIPEDNGTSTRSRR